MVRCERQVDVMNSHQVVFIGLNARKALLIMGVMTLHSFSEGIGIGVSFGGHGGESRGLLISTSLAIHNVPEGLAVSLVLVPKGLAFIHAFIWSIGSRWAICFVVCC